MATNSNCFQNSYRFTRFSIVVSIAGISYSHFNFKFVRVANTEDHWLLSLLHPKFAECKYIILYKVKSFVNNFPGKTDTYDESVVFRTDETQYAGRAVILYYIIIIVSFGKILLTSNNENRNGVGSGQDIGVGAWGNVSPEREVLFSSSRPPSVVNVIYHKSNYSLHYTRTFRGNIHHRFSFSGLRNVTVSVIRPIFNVAVSTSYLRLPNTTLLYSIYIIII